MNNNPIKGQRWSTKKPEPITAQWIPSGKYFIKCSNCGHTIFNSYRITAPRKCPKCDKYMYEVIKRPSAVIEHYKLSILKAAAEESMYGKKKEEK
jgi:DNA replicative helicase MCM subunit Mcm2 (Cdc46/Mcm family)